jgi:multicomponent Na+:H+ antiporter subunit G
VTRLVVSDALLAVSLLVTVLSTIGALTMRTIFGKLHYLTPVTTVAGPLFGVALIVILLALSSPILQMAMGRAAAQDSGVLQPEAPV